MNRKKWLCTLMAVVMCSYLIVSPVQSLFAQGTPTLQDFSGFRLDKLNFTTVLPVHNSISAKVQHISSETTPTRIPIYVPLENQALRKFGSVESEFARAVRSRLSVVVPQSSRTRVVGAPRYIVMEATRVKTVTEKLEILSEALMNRNFKGVGKLRLNDFLDRFLTNAARELGVWLADTCEDREFQNLFRGSGPWMLIFLATSPTSLDNCLDGGELPGYSENILLSKKLPIDMSVKRNGDTLEVEIRGDDNLAIKFKVNGANKVSFVN